MSRGAWGWGGGRRRPRRRALRTAAAAGPRSPRAAPGARRPVTGTATEGDGVACVGHMRRGARIRVSESPPPPGLATADGSPPRAGPGGPLHSESLNTQRQEVSGGPRFHGVPDCRPAMGRRGGEGGDVVPGGRQVLGAGERRGVRSLRGRAVPRPPRGSGGRIGGVGKWWEHNDWQCGRNRLPGYGTQRSNVATPTGHGDIATTGMEISRRDANRENELTDIANSSNPLWFKHIKVGGLEKDPIASKGCPVGSKPPDASVSLEFAGPPGCWAGAHRERGGDAGTLALAEACRGARSAPGV